MMISEGNQKGISLSAKGRGKKIEANPPVFKLHARIKFPFTWRAVTGNGKIWRRFSSVGKIVEESNKEAALLN